MAKLTIFGRTISFERRDSISNPTKWLTLAFGGGTDTASGINVNEVVALRLVAVWACVNLLSKTVASLPLPIYRRLPDGSRQRIPQHPLYKILDRQPNDRMTSFTFRQTLAAHLFTWGNAYAFIDYDNAGRVKSLYPLLPDRTRPQLDTNGNLIYITRIKKDPQSIAPSDNEQITLPPERVLHIPGLGFDGLKGYSVIGMMRENIGIGLALAEYAGRFFGNGAVPGIVLQSDQPLSPEQKTLLKTQWEEGHQGLTNAQRVAILPLGLKVQQIGIPPEDAQFLESRKLSRSEIASVYGIPPHMIGDVERTTSWGTGIEQQAIGFLVYTMLPILEAWQQAIHNKLFLESEQEELFCEFLVDGLVRGDIATRYNSYNIAFGKWMTGNTIAAKENLPLLGPAGDQLYAPSGMIPLDENGAPQLPAAPPTEEPAPDEAQPSAAAAPVYDVRTARQRLASAQLAALTAGAQRILARERADLVPKAEKYKLSDATLDSFYEEHRTFATRAMLPLLETYAENVRLSVEQELGHAVPPLDNFVHDYAEAFAKRHSDESRSLVADRSAAALEMAFGPSVRRAARIAQRESVQAGNAFAKALYRAAGVTTFRWLLGDERPECRTRDNAIFTETDKFLHPPLGEGCDCVLAAVSTRTVAAAQNVAVTVDPMWLTLKELAPRAASVNVTLNPDETQERIKREAEELNKEEVTAIIAGMGKMAEAIQAGLREQVPPKIENNFTMPPISAPVVNVSAELKMPEDNDTEIVYHKDGKVKGQRKVKKLKD